MGGPCCPLWHCDAISLSRSGVMMRLNKWAIIILLLLQQKVGDHVFFVSQHLASILYYHRVIRALLPIQILQTLLRTALKGTICIPFWLIYILVAQCISIRKGIWIGGGNTTYSKQIIYYIFRQRCPLPTTLLVNIAKGKTDPWHWALSLIQWL